MNAVHRFVLFSYVGSHCHLWVRRFRTQAVVFICGWLSCGGGGGGLRGQSQYLVATLRGVCLHTHWWSLRLVTWPLDVVGEGVVLGACRRWWVVCCHPAIVVAWSSSVVVMVVVSHCCCWSWLLMWHSCVVRMVYQCVLVVVGGGWWCGDNGWVLWVGVVSGHCGWALWVVVGGGGGG